MSDNDTHFLRDVKLYYDQVSQIMSGPRSVIDSDDMRQAIAAIANNARITDEARKSIIEAMSQVTSIMRYTSRTDKKRLSASRHSEISVLTHLHLSR